MACPRTVIRIPILSFTVRYFPHRHGAAVSPTRRVTDAADPAIKVTHLPSRGEECREDLGHFCNSNHPRALPWSKKITLSLSNFPRHPAYPVARLFAGPISSPRGTGFQLVVEDDAAPHSLCSAIALEQSDAAHAALDGGLDEATIFEALSRGKRPPSLHANTCPETDTSCNTLRGAAAVIIKPRLTKHIRCRNMLSFMFAMTPRALGRAHRQRNCLFRPCRRVFGCAGGFTP